MSTCFEATHNIMTGNVLARKIKGRRPENGPAVGWRCQIMFGRTESSGKENSHIESCKCIVDFSRMNCSDRYE